MQACWIRPAVVQRSLQGASGLGPQGESRGGIE
jgi:hypothetical protein